MNTFADKVRNKMKVLFLAVGLAAVAGAVIAEGAMPTHLDKLKNVAGCSGCHHGHGKRGTMMLATPQKDICFTCHGPDQPGLGRGAKTDMLSVFKKRYSHPVIETADYHVQGEELPEKNPATPRHVACDDCHQIHAEQEGEPLRGARGHRRGAAAREVADHEYEVCYLCHSESANLPSQYTNQAEEFDVGNASYHPIEAPGRNKVVPSLKPPYDVSSTIDCSDCHGNNDQFGPQGPHGSDYEFMLKKQYITNETAEGPDTYELCYSCHNRQSILGNESFKKHNEHIVYFHAPCAACHVSHGSKTNPNLIELKTKFAGPFPLPSYMPSNNGRPSCYLTCHIGGRDVVHDSAFYSTKNWP